MNNKTSHILEMVVVFVLTIGATFGLVNTVLNNQTLLPEAASLQAIPIDNLFTWHWGFIAFFFSLIVVFMLYSIIRSMVKYGWNPTGDGYGEHFEGNTQLEIIWTAVPLAIVLFIAYLGANAIAEVERRDVQAMEVNVIASQWNWFFEYPETGVTSSELYIPVDRQIILRMRSEDVIHSFWVPEFRVKQDILPDKSFDGAYVRELRISPTETGFYKVRCAELCGSQHYAMLATVIVVEQDDFTSWMTEKAAGCELGAVECGQRWVTEYGCTACHSLDGTVVVGPSWQNLFGSEIQLADGSSVVADEAYVFKSIMEPNAQIHVGFNPDVMPQNFAERLTEEQIAEIVAFIQTVGDE